MAYAPVAGMRPRRGLRMESLEGRQMLTITIEVLDFELQPDQAHQQVPILIHSDSATDPAISDLVLHAQIGDGATTVPKFQIPTGGIDDYFTGLGLTPEEQMWDNAVDGVTATGGPVGSEPHLLQANVSVKLSGSGTVNAIPRADYNGKVLAVVEVDTTGFTGGTWDLKLSGTDITGETDTFLAMPGPSRIESTGSPAPLVFSNGSVFIPSANSTIEGRHVFYNNSAFDGNDAGANVADDGAIATDKQALLPGSGAATFANYTSYSRGINGIMIDVSEIPDGITFDPSNYANDFAFKIGNSNTPSSWADAPDPTNITVREDVGTNGSDRITITWADNAIQKQWLQVTVKAGGNTNVGVDDVFYFGNAIGETNNIPGNTTVDTLDIGKTRLNRQVRTPAEIDNLYDFNRDKSVDTLDVGKSRLNRAVRTTLLLIDPS